VCDKDVQLIDEFAERYSLSWEIDIHGIKPVIVGKDGAFIYVYDEANGNLGICFCPDDLPGDGWNLTIQSALHCGMKIIRDCLSEAYLAFDPKNEKQCSMALALCQATPAPDAIAQNALTSGVIAKARQRKAKQLEHQRVLKELALERKGCDLSDYDPTYQPSEYRLTL